MSEFLAGPAPHKNRLIRCGRTRWGNKETMPDIILPGSAGRIEARYQRQKNPGAPMALVLHPHPQFSGTMNNPLVYDLFHMFHGLGCTTVRFNFRGLARSQ